MTATDIKIVLTRMNTFGDEVFGDPKVLKSYFYAVSDLAVGARYCFRVASYIYPLQANLIHSPFASKPHTLTLSELQANLIVIH